MRHDTAQRTMCRHEDAGRRDVPHLTASGQRRRKLTSGTLVRVGEGGGGADVIRLIVADDHPLWRETLKGLLEHGGTASVVAEAGTGDEALEAAKRVPADVVLMDIDMPERDGIDATRDISQID